MATTVLDKTTTKTGLDTNILNNVTLTSDTPMTVGFDKSSTKSVGFTKAINMFYRIFMTPKGSDPHNTSLGTEFTTILSTGMSDEEAVFASVKTDVSDALTQVINFQSLAKITSDEKVVGATIVGFEYLPTDSVLNLSIELYNILGEKAVLEMPSTVI